MKIRVDGMSGSDQGTNCAHLGHVRVGHAHHRQRIRLVRNDSDLDRSIFHDIASIGHDLLEKRRRQPPG